MPLTLSNARHDSAASSGADSTRSDQTVTPSTFPDFYNPQGSDDHNGFTSGDTGPDSYNKSAIAPWEMDSDDDTGLSQPKPGRSNAPFSNTFSFGDSENGPSLDPDRPPDDRRPSVASGATGSSTGSGRSNPQGIRKKLHGFFGEEPPANSDNPPSQNRPSFPRISSYSAQDESNPAERSTPNASRPLTPQPSSEVTPWMFQDPADSPSPGNTASRGDAPPNSQGTGRAALERSTTSLSKASQGQRLHLHRQRTQRSGDDTDYSAANDQGIGAPLTRHESFSPFRRHTRKPSNADTFDSDTSNSPSVQNGSPLSEKQIDGSGGSGKKSILGRLRGKIKDSKLDPRASVSIDPAIQQQANRQARPPPPDSSLALARTASIVEDSGPQKPAGKTNGTAPKKEHHSRLPFKNRRQNSSMDVQSKDPNKADPVATSASALWSLDTDLDDMEGIVSNPQPLPTAGTDGRMAWPGDDPSADPKDLTASGGAWDAPDSWVIQKVETENAERSRELDADEGQMAEDDDGTPYCVRIFRVDSTFATLSVGLNTTVGEIIQILGKKTFLQDDLDNYQIVMRRHGTIRQLKASERPLVIQKRLLQQAGYNDSDNIGELGRDDHSYLCRFTFLPAKMTGFASLEKDPGFTKMQKFSNVDLQGRNLITIPLMLYKKASEILTLNLSRNISLDVPRDFISSCSSLREIKYTGNEAWKLPPGLSLASRLTVLDVSNNRLEQLDDVELYKLDSLVSLKLSNNRLRSLPDYFSKFKSLRSLLVSSNSLGTFPESLCRLKSLVDLDISFNSISSIPDIGGLESLEKLWATNNNLLGEFATSIANCKSLREIDVRFNKIDDIHILSHLPQLEVLQAGHNQVTAFEGAFSKLRILLLDHNPVTRFAFTEPIPTLATLNLASAKLAHLADELFPRMPGLNKLVLDKNHFTSLTQEIGKLQRLDCLSIAKNLLSTLPSDIGRLTELRYLDVRENNIQMLPPEIWFCRKLETLNLSANVLDCFPKPSTQVPAGMDMPPLETPATTPGLSIPESPGSETSESAPRRMSQASSYFSLSHSPPNQPPHRKESLSSMLSTSLKRNPTLARTSTESAVLPLARINTEASMAPLTRKDSVLMNRQVYTFAGSLRNLYLADNRLPDDIFDQLQLLPELRIVNLSFNELYEIPPRTIRRWSNLVELYLSGNNISCLPAEDLEEISSLRTLHINCNKFQTLPSELAKLAKLAILDVGSNSLKYNVNNWPYDWNWNWNPKLKYLNFSGNKRLEIKPASAYNNQRTAHNLTDFTSLTNLRTLGLMDVTLMISSIPDETEDRRVRTSGSSVGAMGYGIADYLGNQEHLSTVDIVKPQLEGHDDETVFGLFDGSTLSNGGSKLVKYLQENFVPTFKEELSRKHGDENAQEPLRRTYLALNKELASLGIEAAEKEQRNISQRGQGGGAQALSHDDLQSGCSATVLYLHGMDLFVSNVGNTEALLISSDGTFSMLTVKHDPASTGERQRIKEAGGYVSRQGKLNDVLDISRAFGFIHLTPSVVATPHVTHVQIQESDELIVLATREMWDYLTPDFAVDIARQMRNDLMQAAQKLRDVAISFGASSKMTVMILGVSDLKRRERAQYRTHSMSMGPSGLPDEFNPAQQRRGRRGRDATLDSKLARLDMEVEPPTGELSLVFTDIKSSTLMWETYPTAMRAAIKMHNETMRRQLRLIGGYEVKTEGDAFMVAFPTVTSALWWCFTIQSQLLDVPWPQEILNSPVGQEVLDPDGNVLYRGLSVRMGIHYGAPVCETDPVTRRMDYFGPMVNRAARISSVADGGQITVSTEFIAEIQRLLETHIESDRSSSVGSEEQANEDIMTYNIRRELRSLSSHGFEVKELGARRLKGLENPEYIYLMYPHSLAGRIAIQQQREEAEKATGDVAGAKSKDSQLTFEVENVWDLWYISLRLEMLCSTLETRENVLRPPETALLQQTREKGGEITDVFLVNFIEHQVCRIEACITTLALRNLVRPFSQGMLSQAGPIADILTELQDSMAELQAWKLNNDIDMAPS